MISAAEQKFSAHLTSLKERVSLKYGLNRRRTPVILQMEVTECGAASLAMVLAYHGRWVPLEELRSICGVSRDGARADSILTAARIFGLEADAYQAEPEHLTELPMPYIIHWDFGHFLVLEGVSKRYAWLNDPAVGPRRVSMEEFNDKFTGMVLGMEPGPDFQRGGKRPNFFRFMLGQLRHSKKALALLLATGLALVVPGILIPGFSRIFVDDVLLAGSTDWMRPLLVGVALTAVLRLFAMSLQLSSLRRLQRKLSITLMARILHHLLKLPMEFFAQRQTGDIVSRISASNSVSFLLANGLSVNVLNLVEVLFFAGMMALLDVQLAVICIGFSMLNLLALLVLGGRYEDLNRSLAMERGKLSAVSAQQVGKLEPIRASGFEDYSFAAYTGQQARYLTLQQQAGVYGALQSMVPSVTTALSNVVLFGLGAMKVMDGELTIGTLVAFQSLLMSFSAPITNLVQLAASIQATKGDMARLLDVFDYPLPTAEELPSTKDPQRWRTKGNSAVPAKLSGHIDIDGLVFGYAKLEKPLIESLSLKVEPGMRIAIVGASGNGKSTLARLLCGLYRPWRGSIRFDGQSVQTIRREIFAASVAFVDQDIGLFEGTLRDNITLWDSSVPDAVIHQALKDASVDTLVEGRPGGLSCTVEEGGKNFSGGERARIEIARALVGEPTILVLDEATSALDTLTEQRIDDALRRRGCTCIIIAHRLSTIRDSDEIILLEKGKDIERGNHEELIALGGAYHALVLKE
jgi:NHLM bacteriocin system ABC transporter peptidase/ATP-binding protein